MLQLVLTDRLRLQHYSRTSLFLLCFLCCRLLPNMSSSSVRISNGAHVGDVDAQGRTPLHAVALGIAGSPATARLLLDRVRFCACVSKA